MKTVTAFAAAALVLGTVSVAGAQSFAPTVPNPTNPAPANPIATNGTPLPAYAVPASSNRVLEGRSVFSPVGDAVGAVGSIPGAVLGVR